MLPGNLRLETCNQKPELATAKPAPRNRQLAPANQQSGNQQLDNQQLQTGKLQTSKPQPATANC